MAPGAHIVSYDWPSSVSNLQAETSQAITTYGAVTSNNSWIWGLCSDYCSYYGEYDDWSQEYDRLVRGSQGAPITVVFAAGNDQNCYGCQDSLVDFPYGTVAGPGGTAIVVGATNAIDKTMTSFSSWGPVKDGRVKPDIVAPGCKPSAGVTTTYPPNAYTSGGCGTSYAAPITTGSVGLLKQQFDRLGYGPVKPHTLKAVLIQSAEDRGNPGPDYKFGHGHLEVQDAIDLIVANDLDGDLIRPGSVGDS
jgi:subtilisin family serine protease